MEYNGSDATKMGCSQRFSLPHSLVLVLMLADATYSASRHRETLGNGIIAFPLNYHEPPLSSFWFPLSFAWSLPLMCSSVLFLEILYADWMLRCGLKANWLIGCVLKAKIHTGANIFDHPIFTIFDILLLLLLLLLLLFLPFYFVFQNVPKATK